MRNGTRRTWVLVAVAWISSTAMAAEREAGRAVKEESGSSSALVAVLQSWLDQLGDRFVATWGESRGIIVPADAGGTNSVLADGSSGDETTGEIVREE